MNRSNMKFVAANPSPFQLTALRFTGHATALAAALIATVLLIAPLRADPPKGLKFPALQFTPPKVEKRLLSCGATVYLLPDRELPLINVSAVVRTGTMYETPEETGLASLCGALMRAGGTETLAPDAMDEKLEFVGASVESGMDVEQGGASLSCLTKDFDATLSIFADVLMKPAFNKEKLEIEKAKLIESIRRRNDDPFQIARREFRKLLYGPDHPLSRTTEIAVIKKIKPADLKRFYSVYYHPNQMMLAVSGDFEIEPMVQKLEAAFKAWRPASVAFPAVRTVAAPDQTQTRVGLAEKSVNQASVIVGHLGVKRHNPDRFALEVMNEILGGGSFSSRLYKEVRTKRGLAYWIGSNFTEPFDFGTMAAGSQTKSESAGETIDAILSEMNRIRAESVTPQELALAKDSIVNSFVFRYASSHAIVSQKMALDYYGYPEDYLETYTQKIAAVTAADVLVAARKYLKPEQITFMVVGDGKKMNLNPAKLGTVFPIELKTAEK